MKGRRAYNAEHYRSHISYNKILTSDLEYSIKSKKKYYNLLNGD